ncbi:MAG TPA: glutamate racemase [Candidatus Sulfotelmatobacter sp.]|jgi:glutamate racemase|nr:glutamate racemase [Candidatus Sulfotelmatobacter sp.]
MNNYPIGILDSGVGGLTVLQTVLCALPQECIMYIGDSKNTPYGAKSPDEIYYLSKKLVEFLLQKEVKLIVIACNTISVTCLDMLRSDYPQIPIIATVPVIKTAVEVSKSKRIGILSTTRTAQSDYQKELIETIANGCIVFNYGTDSLVPLIEQGKIESTEMTTNLQKILVQFQKENIDALVLGCTHFPFLEKQMQAILGHKVQLLNSGGAIAQQLKRVLEHNGILSLQKDGSVSIYTTGNVNIAKNLAQRTIEGQRLAVHKILLNNEN